MAERATILILIKGLGIGGAEKLISEGSAFWDRDRFNYHVAYVLPWKDQLVTDITDNGFEVTCLGGSRGTTPPTLLRLRRLIDRIDAELVHAHLPATGVLARLASPVPVVYTEHNLAASYRLPVKLLNRLTYWRNAAVTAVSAPVAQSLYGYPGPDPIVIPNGVSISVNTEDAMEARTESGVSAGAPVIVHVGNIRPHKGHEILIDAARRLAKSRPDITIISIGGEKHSGDLERFRNLAKDVPQLRFLGSRPDASAFIAAADVLVNPSTVEGLPVTILEAMALETPIVATAVGGVPSAVRDGETGILVPPGDPTALAKAVLQLLDDPETAARLAAAAKGVVEHDFGLGSMIRCFEDLYEDLLRG